MQGAGCRVQGAGCRVQGVLCKIRTATLNPNHVRGGRGHADAQGTYGGPRGMGVSYGRGTPVRFSQPKTCWELKSEIKPSFGSRFFLAFSFSSLLLSRLELSETRSL